MMIALEYDAEPSAIADGWKWSSEINRSKHWGVSYRDIPFTGTLVFRSPANHEWEFTSFLDGKLHSFEDNPAAIKGELRRWYKYGNSHREAGPAMESPKHEGKFCYNGHIHKFEEWLTLTPISPAEKVLLKMQYG